MSKIDGNVQNDLKAMSKLEDMGWKIIIIWECDLKPRKLSETIAKLPGKIVS
jgi:DNA mismatch endonuclease (patch repair protein)